MNPMMPLFVIIPLAGAFLIMITGRFSKVINKYLALVVLALLAFFSISALINCEGNLSLYKIGGWEPVNKIPVGIYMVMDSFTVIVLCIINFIVLMVYKNSSVFKT